MIKHEIIKSGALDLRNFLEVFVVTNGRSTFKYADRAIRNQKEVTFKYTTISDMKWVDANNKILDLCESTLFLRVDDDMFLHESSVLFMYNQLQKFIRRDSKKRKPPVTYGWYFWDFTVQKPWYGVKVYVYELAKKIGFRADIKLEKKIFGYAKGKIDFIFFRDAKKKFGYKSKNDGKVKQNDIIGIVGFVNMEEQLEYRKIRLRDLCDLDDKIGEYKERQEETKNFNMSPKDQYAMLLDYEFMLKINKKIKTKYYKYLLQK